MFFSSKPIVGSPPFIKGVLSSLVCSCSSPWLGPSWISTITWVVSFLSNCFALIISLSTWWSVWSYLWSSQFSCTCCPESHVSRCHCRNLNRWTSSPPAIKWPAVSSKLMWEKSGNTWKVLIWLSSFHHTSKAQSSPAEVLMRLVLNTMLNTLTVLSGLTELWNFLNSTDRSRTSLFRQLLRQLSHQWSIIFTSTRLLSMTPPSSSGQLTSPMTSTRTWLRTTSIRKSTTSKTWWNTSPNRLRNN